VDLKERITTVESVGRGGADAKAVFSGTTGLAIAAFGGFVGFISLIVAIVIALPS